MTELGRRLVHVSGSAIPLSHLLGIDWLVIQWVVLVGAATALVLEVLRLTHTVEWWLFDRLTRDYEWRSIAGYAFYAFGFAIVAWTVDPPIAVAAMLMLAIGDPVSGYLGSGEQTVKRTPVLLVTFAITLSIAVLLGIPILAAAAGALVATVADGVTLKIGTRYIDDNIAIPVGAATAMWLVGAFL
ncbi:Dolichol kinase [Halanaeroarchaeum sp. HSR-CO]|uniref:dolichol kinase n=1 Tax=Halanaeroarchaeum sp. HSR-CO TaxID=2866382 RepID=UPI00217EDA6A|nr:dolichol kinase [Halanaeroarchaeum sp. HSR-CO]UWG46390.1 Dolichol kinase [Halanaeroarchaeum sp. HSR-CO]